MAVGFGNNTPHEHPKDIYIGKFICVNQNGNTVYGVLHSLDRIEGVAYFSPSIVMNAKGELELAIDDPTTMDFPLSIIRLMRGTPEQYVKTYNARLKQKTATKKIRKK